MKVCAEQNMAAVGMTDHGNLFGAVSFYNSAEAAGIHPVIGGEVYVSGNYEFRTSSPLTCSATEYDESRRLECFAGLDT